MAKAKGTIEIKVNDGTIECKTNCSNFGPDDRLAVVEVAMEAVDMSFGELTCLRAIKRAIKEVKGE